MTIKISAVNILSHSLYIIYMNGFRFCYTKFEYILHFALSFFLEICYNYMNGSMRICRLRENDYRAGPLASCILEV